MRIQDSQGGVRGNRVRNRVGERRVHRARLGMHTGREREEIEESKKNRRHCLNPRG